MATAYHRLARDHPDYAGWKLLVAGFGGAIVYFGVVMVLMITGMVTSAVVLGPEGFEDLWESSDDLGVSASDPFMLLMLLGSVALMLPAIWYAVRLVAPKMAGYLSSVEGHLRWRWLGLMSLLAAGVYGVGILGAMMLEVIDGDAELTSPTRFSGTLVATILVILLVTPVQATAEEYVFRGYLFQFVGSWTRFAAVPVLVSLPVFVLLHGYDIWGLIDVGIFALLASFLVLRTGGLEAAMAAHTANNVVLFLVEALGFISFGDFEHGPIDLVPTLVTSLVFAGLVEVLVRHTGLKTTRDPLPPNPEPVRVWVPFAYPVQYPYPPQYPHPQQHPWPPQPHPYPGHPPQPQHPYPYPPPQYPYPPPSAPPAPPPPRQQPPPS